MLQFTTVADRGNDVEHHLQALVFIIYFVVTILVLYDVHQSRL